MVGEACGNVAEGVPGWCAGTAAVGAAATTAAAAGAGGDRLGQVAGRGQAWGLRARHR